MPRVQLCLLPFCATVVLSNAACGNDCEPLGQELAAASAAAERCDPTAETPCAAFYTGCVYIGIDPSETERLTTLVAAYKDAECVKAPPPCPQDLGPPDYVCQAASEGLNVCVVSSPQ